MSFFAGPSDAYDRFMGRYSGRLAPLFADFAGIEPGRRILDVGCGPGALTVELARRVGADRVAATDPSAGFARACAERVGGADVRTAPAEALPWGPQTFDVVLAQLVVSFLDDAPAGVREMRRVARTGGVVAACTWDLSGGMRMLRTFWDAALALDGAAPDEAGWMPYTDPDSLAALWREAELDGVETAPLVVEVEYRDFDDYWEPFLTGPGPAGAYCASLDADHRAALRDECRRRLGAPGGAFRLTARAWAARGVA